MSKNPDEDMEPFLDEEREREKRLRAALCLDFKLKCCKLIDLDALPRSVDRGGVVDVPVSGKVIRLALVLTHTGLLQPRPS